MTQQDQHDPVTTAPMAAPIVLTAAELAEVAAVDRQTVEHWRRAGIGPAPVTAHPETAYDLAEVQRFLAARQPQEKPA